MKKILGLAFALMIGSFVFGQSPITFAEDLASYDKATAASYHFGFSDAIDGQAITDNAQYYTDYFTVSSTAAVGGHDVVITLVQDDDMSRKVVSRYFTQFQVQTINVDGNEVSVDNFMNTYIYQ